MSVASYPDVSSYLDALNYFYSFIQYNPDDTSSWSLRRVQELLERLDNPHQKFPALLIAGSKGKGSTAAICESVLRYAGYKTGLYTSPHLHSFRERIRISGQPIPAETVISLANKLKPYFDSTPGLTAFELITVLAFVTFAELEIEVAVVEVGLGGRTDVTNAIDPAVAVITPISYNHTEILGKTLGLIAREKAGIIRPNAVVVSAPQPAEARLMIEEVCDTHQARLVYVDRDCGWQITDFGLEGQTFTIDHAHYTLPLIGDHQVVNAVTAIAAVQCFTERTGFKTSTEAIKSGVANVEWPGRMEILSHRPCLVMDSAVNKASAEQLVDSLKKYFPDRKITFVFGASADAKIREMLEVLLPVANGMFVAASRHPRSAQPEYLTSVCAEIGYAVTPMESVQVALDAAISTAANVAPSSTEGLVCVTGSLFLVADVREHWFRLNDLPLPPVDPMTLS